MQSPPAREEAAFTLPELLTVIVVLGVLASAVVFAAPGITDRGQSVACSTDRSSQVAPLIPNMS